jgi:hypothetical protein
MESVAALSTTWSKSNLGNITDPRTECNVMAPPGLQGIVQGRALTKISADS